MPNRPRPSLSAVPRFAAVRAWGASVGALEAKVSGGQEQETNGRSQAAVTPFSSQAVPNHSTLLGQGVHQAQATNVGMHGLRGDGPSVFREVVPVSTLEKDARLRGRLAPPIGSAPPPGVTVRTQGDGTRLLSLNVHMGVPADVELDPRNESIDALRDMARYINAVDPDAVIVQELRDRPMIEGQEGLPHISSILFHLMQASDMAFTPAIEGDPVNGRLRHYGTGIYTRNGFSIDRAVNVALTNHDEAIERRSAGVAAIRAPDSSLEPSTVIFTHLANRPVEDQALRDEQLDMLGQIAELAHREGSFSYVDALTGEKLRAHGFPGERILLGGDLNQKQEPTDAVMKERWGMHHVNDLLARDPDPAKQARAQEAREAFTAEYRGTPHRIDHILGRGVKVTDAVVAGVAAREYGGPERMVGNVRLGSTDHNGLIVNFL